MIRTRMTQLWSPLCFPSRLLPCTDFIIFSKLYQSSSESSNFPKTLLTTTIDEDDEEKEEISIYERIAQSFFEDHEQYYNNNSIETQTFTMNESFRQQQKQYVNTVTLLRVGLPSLGLASIAKICYPTLSMLLANLIHDSGVFAVVSQDASQYIQNILTTSGLMFSILLGQTYYFMYQQQEAIYLALFEEVTVAKSLLEQVALVSQGRKLLYEEILYCIQNYVQNDLTKFNDVQPAQMMAGRPCDDPLEQILYLTSVGEPSLVYQTVRSLRQARSARLGALQRKLPALHMILLWTLATIVLSTFPLLGAGVQTIGGMGILSVQSWYFGIIVWGISLTMGVIQELRRPSQVGAYNARSVLLIMVAGLQEELQLRLSGQLGGGPLDGSWEPSVDSDGYAAPTTFFTPEQ